MVIFSWKLLPAKHHGLHFLEKLLQGIELYCKPNTSGWRFKLDSPMGEECCQHAQFAHSLPAQDTKILHLRSSKTANDLHC